MFHCITTAVIIVTAACVCYNQYAQADEANAKNVADLELLCHVINLHTDDASAFDDSDLQTMEHTELEKINMSLSLPMWQVMFPKEIIPDEEDPNYCKEAKPKEQCITQWNSWKKAAVAAAKADSLPTKAVIYPEKLRGPAGAAARLAINALLAEAEALVEDYKSRLKPIIASAKAAQTGQIQDAIFGAASDPTTTNKRCQITMAADRVNACKVTAAAATVCGTAVCLCAKDDTQQNGELCSGATSSTRLTYSDSTNVATIYETIHTKCKRLKNQKLTAPHIRSLVTAFKARLKTKGDAGGALVYYGSDPTNAHCGSAANEGCVDFTGISAAKASASVSTDNWLHKLLAAADTVAEGERAVREKKATGTQLQKVLRQAQRVYETVEREEALITQVGQSRPVKGQGELSRATDECEDKPKGNCDPKKCEWKGTDDKGKCEPKAVEETGEKDGKTGTTNTTGSNSFVISRAPLLLALRLLPLNF
uniref:Variant surface glycoprotein 1125.376 n=1 Tax=Trypanosoma brucei TaxID=5691 RepID=A0A1J0R5Q5_9TRYP|nr:variant surface glycoprotein 1125.376 [Trypanosoma brucei]